MKKIKSIFAILTLATIITSCSMSTPLMVTDNENKKEGVAQYSVFLGIFRPMDADISIVKAAENGGITRVASVDKTFESSLFGLKKTFKTVVTGN